VRWARRALETAAAALALCGCAQQTVSIEPPPRPPVAAPASRPGFVIAVPVGTTDAATREVAAELARRTGFALVVGAGVDVDAGRVQQAAGGDVTFYAELHGSDRREAASRIEIATVGVDRSLALRLRTLYELIRDAHLRGQPGAPAVGVRVEPADAIAARSRGDGLVRPPGRALHLELPRVARAEARETYTAILADFLTQAATLPAGR
jgi:hypothetical protein